MPPPPIPERKEAVNPPPIPKKKEAVDPPPIPEGKEAVNPPPIPEGKEVVNPPPIPEKKEAVTPPPIPERKEAVNPPLIPVRSGPRPPAGAVATAMVSGGERLPFAGKTQHEQQEEEVQARPNNPYELMVQAGATVTASYPFRGEESLQQLSFAVSVVHCCSYIRQYHRTNPPNTGS
ncbi:unnamed protein product [Ectocarpus sp. 12 AP-2014]